MKTRVKRSKIWHQYSDEEFSEIVRNAKSCSEILSKFGLSYKGGNYHTIRARIQYLGLDDNHIAKGVGANKGRKFVREKIELEKVMVENSTFSRKHLKKRLLDEGIFQEKCYKCGLNNEWKGERLVMILDHINGIPNDNRRENLRMLCPNCNSQTATFAGRNNK